MHRHTDGYAHPDPAQFAYALLRWSGLDTTGGRVAFVSLRELCDAITVLLNDSELLAPDWSLAELMLRTIGAGCQPDRVGECSQAIGVLLNDRIAVVELGPVAEPPFDFERERRGTRPAPESTRRRRRRWRAKRVSVTWSAPGREDGSISAWALVAGVARENCGAATRAAHGLIRGPPARDRSRENRARAAEPVELPRRSHAGRTYLQSARPIHHVRGRWQGLAHGHNRRLAARHSRRHQRRRSITAGDPAHRAARRLIRRRAQRLRETQRGDFGKPHPNPDHIPITPPSRLERQRQSRRS